MYNLCFALFIAASSINTLQGDMGGLNLYLHSPVVQLPSFSALRRTPRLGIPPFSLKEIGDRPLVWSIRADGNRESPKKKASQGREAPDAEDNPQSFDGRTSLTSNKEEILALFKRIQSSISKGGETLNPKKRNPKAAEDKSSPSPSAESILEVLHQSRTRGKGKTVGKNRDKFVAPQKDSWKKEDRREYLSTTRPPSSFTRRSPIPTLSTASEEIQSEIERLPTTPSLSIPMDEIEVKSEGLAATDDDDNDLKLEEMKLSQLKEVAKSKGIKGYSKLKKSELVDLLIRSLNDIAP